MKLKLKTRSAARKRFKQTKTGKILYKKAFRGHLLEKKSQKRKRHIKLNGLLKSTEVKRISLMLPK
jgi:large subunit ribosomal protein L35